MRFIVYISTLFSIVVSFCFSAVKLSKIPLGVLCSPRVSYFSSHAAAKFLRESRAVLLEICRGASPLQKHSPIAWSRTLSYLD